MGSLIDTRSHPSQAARASMLDPERPEDINARLARYAATLDGRDLWPEGTASGFRAGQAELARGVAAVLAGGPRPVPLPLPPPAGAPVRGRAAPAPPGGSVARVGWRPGRPRRGPNALPY